MFLAMLKCIAAVTTIGFISIGIHELIFNTEDSRCEMTWMFDWPEYIPVPIDAKIQRKFPKYSLAMYGEGQYAEDLKNLQLYHGVPVLFIPGNAGAMRQYRPIASVALQKAVRWNFHFVYFSVGFQEEMSALKGTYLHRQTEFVHECLKTILKLFNDHGHKQESVLILGLSIGGLIARGLFTLPGFDPSTVKTLITLSTPNKPVILADADLDAFYSKVNRFWKDHSRKNWSENAMRDLVVVSIGGGNRDMQVRSDLTSVASLWLRNQSISVVASAIPKVWLSTCHRRIVWCKQLVLAVTRSLFDMVDSDAVQVMPDPAARMAVLRYHFEASFSQSNSYKELKYLGSVLSANRDKKCRLTTMSFVSLTSKSSSCYVMDVGNATGVVSALYQGNSDAWIASCDDGAACNRFKSLAVHTKLAPIKNGQIKVFRMDVDKLRKIGRFFRFAVQDRNSDKLYGRIFDKISSSFDVKKPFLFAPSVGTISNQRIFTRINFQFLHHPFVVYKSNVTFKCRRSSPVSARFHVPWFNEDVYYTEEQLQNISLKFNVERPMNSSGIELHLWFGTRCNFSITTRIDLKATSAQLLKFNYEEILRWVSAFSIIWLALTALQSHASQDASQQSVSRLMPYSIITVSAFLLMQVSAGLWFSRHPVSHSLLLVGFWSAAAFAVLVLLQCVISMMFLLVRAVAFLVTLPFRALRRPMHLPSQFRYLWYFLEISLPIIASWFFCGSLGIVIILILTLLKNSITGPTFRHPIILCTIAVLIIRAPSLAAWVKDLRFGYKLDADPFMGSAIGFSIANSFFGHSATTTSSIYSAWYLMSMLLVSFIVTCNCVPLYQVPDLICLAVAMHCLFAKSWNLEFSTPIRFYEWMFFSSVKKDS